ncbi:PREDICTED: probable leucine-rich repeat receptor-like protein kinase At1g68400 [Ipomoea nil]|uniref:probable leucine-rich repeat receptor-like protein kinase At1g68400 n=1 Tax=Ipomoea nil TaxID=35883 RepID=UPI0009011C1B|nr:PREDICTED: probable leucine-rich repeat receptor-like protein kinase At1g68400 [Ipomoea nil]
MAKSSGGVFGVVFMVVMVMAASEIYPEERNALLQLRDGLQSNANLHSKWTGPPCEGNTSNWPGIACSDWHVTRLLLQGINLTGSLPVSFLQNLTLLTKLDLTNNSIFGPLPYLSPLSRLEFLFLSQNQFSGSIPLGYIHIPNLKHLGLDRNGLQGSIPPFDQPSLIGFNVSGNRLEGKIPETAALQRFSESSYGDNPGLCGKPLDTPCRIPPPSPLPSPPPTIPMKKKKKKKGLEVWSIALIAGAGGALLTLSIMLIVLCCCYRRALSKKEAESEQKERVPTEHTERRSPWSRGPEDPEKRVELEFFNKEGITVGFDLDDLLRASAEVLGKGKLSTTYKATLEGGSVVAVKRLSQINSASKKEFIQQMQLLGNLKHENLAEIVSFYYSRDEKLIIYEYIPHGSLHHLLHDNRGIGRVPINWEVRLSIVKDIAKGLAYLHHSLPSHKAPHGNIASSNVLIQHRDGSHRQAYQPKLADYGLLPLLPSRESSARLAVARSPEFCQGKKLSGKADVYCFGIVLLEVITGKSPGALASPGNAAGDGDLTDWVKAVVNNDWSTDILDLEILADKEGYDEMLKLTDLALQCTDTQPERRPTMGQVLRRIEVIEGEGEGEGERKQFVDTHAHESPHHS